jgi:small conductance mechanosensitive channel
MKIEKFYDQAYIWIIRYAPGFLIGLLVLFVGLWLINLLLKWWQAHMQKKEIDPTIKPFLQSLVGVVLRVLLILGVVQIMGVSITLFTALVGAFGVAAGLALSGTLQNFASGVLILLLKPFVVGDNIIAQGLEGTVTAIQIFYTVVKTFDNRIVIIPNSKLSNEVIINISREGTRRLDIELKFTNNIDYNEVKSVINSSIEKYTGNARQEDWYCRVRCRRLPRWRECLGTCAWFPGYQAGCTGKYFAGLEGFRG